MDTAMLVVLLLGGWIIYNSWWEQQHRHRCGARTGLLGRCSAPTADAATRCSAHTGLPKKRFP
jgi:hypothetical protein